MPRGLSPAVTNQSPNGLYADNPYVYHEATTPHSSDNVIVLKPGNVYSRTSAYDRTQSLTNVPTISPIVSDPSCTAFTPHGHNYSITDYTFQLSQKPQVNELGK